LREWEALVSAALLGTARRPLDLSELPESVRGLVNGGDPERTLLSAAALLTGYRRAGRLPESNVTLLSRAPEDPRAVVGPDAAYRLAMLLFGERGNLLAEWLRTVQARGLRVPPERLPVLADAARGRPELRPLVAEAAGPRGPWLAELMPDWGFLAERSDNPQVWTYGTANQRHAWLTDLRTRDPDAARTALAEVWPSEPAPVRVQFLSALGTRLSTSDEQFLEAALDDRARDVRRLAGELLAALPGSALSERTATRLRALVSIRGRTLAVQLPASCDDAMRRDGVNPTPPRGVGERAWWFGQLVSTAPLSVWTGLGQTADELVRMPVEGCDRRLLLLGWSAAAVREQNAEWVRALLDGDTALALDQVARLISALPRDQWATAVRPFLHDQLPTALVQALPAPWPVDLGDLILDRIASGGDRRLAHVADIAAYAVPPECLHHPLTRQVLEHDAAPWRRRLVDTLAFRRGMHEELP
jgi:hypothetical protein